MLAAACEQFAAIAIGLRVPKTTKTQIQAASFYEPSNLPCPRPGSSFQMNIVNVLLILC